MPPSVIAYLGLGSNIGRRPDIIRRALRLLDAHPHISLLQTSSFYATSPVGPAQRAFINAVAEIRTTLPPSALLAELKSLEKQLGRTTSKRWGPRRIDLDILIYGDLRIALPHLTLPHPRMNERAFVLIPLAEIVPELKHPLAGRPIRELAASVVLTHPEQKVRIYPCR